MFNRSEGLNRIDIDRYLHLLIVTGVLTEEVKIGLHDRVFNYVRIGPEAEKVTTTGTNYNQLVPILFLGFKGIKKNYFPLLCSRLQRSNQI